MSRVEHVNHWWRLVLVALFAGIFLPLMGMATVAHAEDGPGHGGPGGGHGDGPVGTEFRGIVEVIPDNSIGVWTISSKQYTVTEQTQIREPFGPIAVDGCVVGEMSSDATYVRELRSAREFACKKGSGDDNGGNTDGHGELYAKLVSFPEGLIGEWVIGSLTFTATADTEFSEKNGPFTVGEFVKVEFAVQQDNSLLAKEIKTVALPNDDGDNDGPGHGHGHDIEHHAVAFGAIETVPNGGAEGVWQIGGITYTVTISTELETEHGALEVGQNARVKYWLDENGNRVAKQIKSMPPAAGGNPQGELKLVGFVEAMPAEADGFVGSWTVAGVELVADANSQFDEEDGVIDVGTFVKVKYRLDGTTRVIVEMEAHVMPGGGDDDHIGKFEQMNDSVAAAAAGASTATWVIGGRSYVVTDATMVGSVATGDTVLVNSYTDTTGAQLATRISTVTLDNLLFIPTALR